MMISTGWRRCFPVLAVAALGLIDAAGTAEAVGPRGREGRREVTPPPGAPLLAVVSISDQRVTIYNAEGRMMQSPISSGATGYETPPGIFSVVQKREVHQSNVYEDGNMPFMQRITWTGIALHAGALPGVPASHGCVRLPMAFAQHLFSLTDIGLRVVIVRDDIAPLAIEHPNLFKPNPARMELALNIPPAGRATGSDRGPPIRMGRPAAMPEATPMPGSPRYMQILKSIAETKASDAAAATRQAAEAKALANRRAAEAAPAIKAVRSAEAAVGKADEQLKAAERALEAAAADTTPEAAKKIEVATLAKDKAAARVGEAQGQLETARQQAQARTDAAARAADDLKAAEAARDAAVEAAEEANRKTSPVSVFISRKTQRLYIRQGYLPVYEGPVTINDPERPIGSFVFTALGYQNNGADARWNVVSMYKYTKDGERVAQAGRRRGAEP
ncbi:MAG TPA: L,D-transpeptidase family protein, partial [Hyphomicrobiaceae bacterium]|nr:L,D-transpeptidase family protein [Hyphomicrobiaceae bacterium]